MATVRAAPKTTTGGSNLADLLERVLDKGIVVAGDVKVKIVDIELLTIQIRLVVCSIDKAKEMGMDWWANSPIFGNEPKTTPALPAAGPDLALGEIVEKQAAVIESLERRLSQLQNQLQTEQQRELPAAAPAGPASQPNPTPDDAPSPAPAMRYRPNLPGGDA